jgi:tetratricopeptide (TPR) repeat protein
MMKKFRLAAFGVSATGLAALCLGFPGLQMRAVAQQAASTANAPAKIHGHAQDPLYQPVTNAKVELTTDGKTPLYTFPTDANGDYKGDGIKPGTYVVELVGNVTDKSGTKTGILDYQKDVRFTPGADVQVDFDMSRQDYISKLPPDVQKQILATRKANAATQKENAKIGNVNKLINEARADRKAGNFDQAVALDTQATQAKPDSGLTWYELGDSYLGDKKYDLAVQNYQKALAIMKNDKKPQPEVIAAANNNLGEALARSGKVNDAVAAYDAAAQADPTKAGMYYQNAAIVLFKTGQADQAATAADKAIAANPNAAVAYYIKGWALVQHATVDAKGKIVLPPGCADAYRKFLSMQPTGPLADDARNILAQAGETVHSSFRKH